MRSKRIVMITCEKVDCWLQNIEKEHFYCKSQKSF